MPQDALKTAKLKILCTPRTIFESTPLAAARALVGATLHWRDCSGIIIETEAYSERNDPACHTARSPKSRAFLETSPPGTLYVYLNYGMHWMLNFVVKSPRESGFVLIRAIHPLTGTEHMHRRRGGRLPLASTPGRLTQALGITGNDHGMDLCCTSDCALQAPTRRIQLKASPRIGISVGTELHWRFTPATPITQEAR